MTTREEFIAALQRTAGGKLTLVQIEDWPPVWVRKVLVDEVEPDEDEVEIDGKKRPLARGGARMICDENGNTLLDSRNPEHVKLLGRQEWERLEKCLAAGQGKGGN